MPDNTFRVVGEKLANALDQHIAREYPDRSEALQVRLAVADYFKLRTVTARNPRRPFPHQSPTDERPSGDSGGDWN